MRSAGAVKFRRGQRGLGDSVHGLQGFAKAGVKGSHDGALHEGRVAQETVPPPVFRQHFESQFSRHDSAAQIHQQEHAVFTPDLINGGKHPGGVGTKCLTAVREAAGLTYGDLTTGHLRGQLMYAGGEFGAVGDDYETYQDWLPNRRALR